MTEAETAQLNADVCQEEIQNKTVAEDTQYAQEEDGAGIVRDEASQELKSREVRASRLWKYVCEGLGAQYRNSC